MSNYVSFSFSSGEVPTTAQWNQIPTNENALANGTAITALTVGSVTSVTNPYKFSAYLTTPWTSSTAYTLIPFDTEEYDTGSNFSTSTHLFEAPVAGFYRFSAYINTTVGNSTQLYGISLYKNGAEWKRGANIETSTTFTTTSQGVGVSPPAFQLLVNDTVGAYFYSSSANSNISGQALTYFGGEFVSNT